MARERIPADSNVLLTYRTPRNGRIRFSVSSTEPVSTYIVDDDGVVEFDEGREIPAYGGFTRRFEHEQQITLPFRGRWHLLIVNREDVAAIVNYDVELR